MVPVMGLGWYSSGFTGGFIIIDLTRYLLQSTVVSGMVEELLLWLSVLGVLFSMGDFFLSSDRSSEDRIA